MLIDRLYRYPVKGLSPEHLDEVALAAGEGLPGDRQFALTQGDTEFDEANPVWLHKTHFAMLARNARLALLHTGYDAHDKVLGIAAPGRPHFRARTDTEEGRAAIARYLADWLGPEARGVPRFVAAPGHMFSDHRNKVVSLINLASLHALERAMDRPLDLLRFRANVYFVGAPAWAENEWVGREIMLGAARLEVTKRIPRCPATEVNLQTGERDCNPPQALRAHFGHVDLGLFARVVEGGRIARGEAITLL